MSRAFDAPDCSKARLLALRAHSDAAWHLQVSGIFLNRQFSQYFFTALDYTRPTAVGGAPMTGTAQCPGQAWAEEPWHERMAAKQSEATCTESAPAVLPLWLGVARD